MLIVHKSIKGYFIRDKITFAYFVVCFDQNKLALKFAENEKPV